MTYLKICRTAPVAAYTLEPKEPEEGINNIEINNEKR